MNDNKTLKGSRYFPVSSSVLFEAFSNPDSLIHWWGPKGFTCTFKSFDFRVGGEWIFTMHSPEGTNFANHQVFEEIIVNEKIVMRHVGAPKFTMTMLYEEEGEGTRLTWIHEFDSAEVLSSISKIAEQGREENFDRLAKTVGV